MDTSPSSLGRLIAHLRERHGMTQKALAEKLGIEQPHVSRLENDKRQPSLEELAALERTLGLDPREAVALAAREVA